MTQRIATPNAGFNDAPFSGDGASLYVSAAGLTTVRYRNIRIVGGGRRGGRLGWIKGVGGVFNIAAASVLKTNRVASVTSPDTFTGGNVWAIPVGLYPGAGLTATFVADVRIHADDVENLISNYGLFQFTIDENGDLVSEIKGTAVVTLNQARAGGVVRIQIRYDPARDGVQPDQFTLTRTAGPTSPADVVVGFTTGDASLVEFTTAALSDFSAYTFDIIAENTGTGTTKTVVSGLSVTADATGPIAPINGEVSTK